MYRSILLSALVTANVATASGLAGFNRFELNFIGEAQVPSGFVYEETIVGGLSGIDYNPSTGSYIAISDDRAEPRFYELTMDLADGWLSAGDVEFTKVTSILDTDGTAFTSSPDPEAIRVLPFPGLLYWTSERLGSDTTPFTRVMTMNGQPLAEFDLPEKFAGVPGVSGTRNNVGFESITYGIGHRHTDRCQRKRIGPRRRKSITCKREALPGC